MIHIVRTTELKLNGQSYLYSIYEYVLYGWHVPRYTHRINIVVLCWLAIDECFELKGLPCQMPHIFTRSCTPLFDYHYQQDQVNSTYSTSWYGEKKRRKITLSTCAEIKVSNLTSIFILKHVIKQSFYFLIYVVLAIIKFRPQKCDCVAIEYAMRWEKANATTLFISSNALNNQWNAPHQAIHFLHRLACVLFSIFAINNKCNKKHINGYAYGTAEPRNWSEYLYRTSEIIIN